MKLNNVQFAVNFSMSNIVFKTNTSFVVSNYLRWFPLKWLIESALFVCCLFAVCSHSIHFTCPWILTLKHIFRHINSTNFHTFSKLKLNASNYSMLCCCQITQSLSFIYLRTDEKRDYCCLNACSCSTDYMNELMTDWLTFVP